MNRVNVRQRRLAILAAVALPFSTVFAFGVGGPDGGDEKTHAAKVLEKNPDLRKKLETDIFKELKEKLPKVQFNNKTYYFAEGDLRLDEDQLLFYAQEREIQLKKYELAKLPGAPGGGPGPGDLVVHVVGGKMMVWKPGTTLTYCVLKKTFKDQEYKIVVDQMKKATGEWAKVCNIKFKYNSGKDNTVPASVPPAGVTFTVRKVDDPTGPIASAFFPGDPKTDRHVLLFPDYFTTNFDKVGVLRHELGHVLGWRHEHIRKEAPKACQGEPILQAIPLTVYDPRSVMHYFCGNVGNKKLEITILDRIGAKKIYGSPIGGLETNPVKAMSADDEFKEAFELVEP